MFEKIVENFIPLNPSRQYNHANSVNGRNREYPREEMSDLLMYPCAHVVEKLNQ